LNPRDACSVKPDVTGHHRRARRGVDSVAKKLP